MSRIGKQKIQIPSGVTVTVENGIITVKGPKGELKRTLSDLVQVTVADGIVTLDVQHPDDKKERSLWGTFGSHIQNMVAGVTEGFRTQLEINGVGYRVAMQGNNLKLEIGFSHPVMYTMPAVVTASVEKNVITFDSIDKEMLGQVAAEVRSIRKPEPYKGKGIRYVGETVRRKAGKAAKAAGE